VRLPRLRRAPQRSSPEDASRRLAELMGQVRRIELRTRGLVASQFAGEYHSVFKGQGMEFAEVREYVPGDDVRTIDWNVSARSGTTFVKKYVEERELTVLLAVDLSASLQWGTRGRLESEMVPEIAATLAMSAVRNNDRVGLLAFTDRVEAFVPPEKGRRHALRIVRDLLVMRPAGRGTALAPALRHASRMLRSRAVVFLVSDFRVGEEGWEAFSRAAGGLAVRHDVVPVVLEDPGDLRLPDAGVLRLMDPETGEIVTVDTASAAARERFAAEAAGRRAALERLFRRLRVDEVRLPTDGSVPAALLSFFRRRERRKRR
jgi:uncharacterized protein (DUF58 family)